MIKSAALIFVLAFPICASAQEVSTLVSAIDASGGISLGPDGNIYVADFGDLASNANGTTVYKVTPQGAFSVFATGFSGASGNEFDADGNLIQANIAAGRVDRVSPAGVRTTVAGNGLQGPVGVAIASNGDIFVANCGGHYISRISGGVVSDFVVGSGLSCPNGLEFDPEGNLYVANFNDGNIYKIDPQGQMALLATTPGTDFRPSGGNGHLVYGNGRMYLTSNATSQIFEMTLDGQLSVLAGSGELGNQDGPADQASFSLPNGIAITPDGRYLYVNTSQHTDPGPFNGNTFQLNPSLVRVIDLGPSFAINAGLNDAWYNRATDGQGIFIIVYPDIRLIFLAWFTYEADAQNGRTPTLNAVLGDDEHRWLTASGFYEEGDDTVELDISITRGGKFDAGDPISRETDGTIKLNFAHCDKVVADYNIPSIERSGSVELERVAKDNVPLCEALSQ